MRCSGFHRSLKCHARSPPSLTLDLLMFSDTRCIRICPVHPARRGVVYSNDWSIVTRIHLHTPVYLLPSPHRTSQHCIRRLQRISRTLCLFARPWLLRPRRSRILFFGIPTKVVAPSEGKTRPSIIGVEAGGDSLHESQESSAAAWCAHARLQAATHPPLPSPEERESLFAKCFSRVRDSQSAAGWFIRSTPEAIRRDNLAEWLLWAIFGTRWAERNDEWAQEIEGYLSRIENLLQRKLHQGWDQTVRCMKVTLDHVDAVHRPLLWYSVSSFLPRAITHASMSRSTKAA